MPLRVPRVPSSGEELADRLVCPELDLDVVVEQLPLVSLAVVLSLSVGSVRAARRSKSIAASGYDLAALALARGRRGRAVVLSGWAVGLGQDRPMAAAPELTPWWAALDGRLPGTAVAVGTSSPKYGRSHWCVGELSQEPVRQSTIFYAASVTKQLVAALVARTVLDGYLDPRDSIRAHLPGLPVWVAPITVRHLLHHTAGLPQPRQLAVAVGYPDDAAGESQLDNQATLVALHRVAPPAVSPGQEFSYDNTGYILLAELLQAVHGRCIADLARTEIFEPLGLTRSRLGGAAPVTFPGYAGPPATIGDGGWWTCAADLLAWLEAINEGRLGVDLTALVQSPGRLEDGTVLDYAWGIGPRPAPAGTLYLHGGEWPGWCAMTVRCPTTATAVAILATTEDMATVSAAAQELHQQLVSSAVSPPS